MRVLVVGGGGREHALVWKLAGERPVSEVICAPGNPGIARLARSVPIDAADPQALLALADREQVDFTVVGPELPLSRGIADLFASEGRLLFGPTREAARLESSKAFAKGLMARCGVPTAPCRVARTADEARAVLRGGEFGFPLVLKADGLASGKGVVIAPDAAAAEAAVAAAMLDRRFGEAGSQIVIEECLRGREVSFFVLTDGQRALPLGSAEDHKRLSDGDVGPNTGGMGAFAPSPCLNPLLQQRILNEIVHPVLRGLREQGSEFRGMLYVGLMLTDAGPKVIEFNVRFGDPEAQVVLPLLDEDLLPLLVAAAAGRLLQRTCAFRPQRHVGVVMASAGYPERAESGRPIRGLAAAEAVPGALVFHAGTARNDGSVVTAGGRVLTVVGRGDDYADAINRAYQAAGCIWFDGMQYRRDIGARAVSHGIERRA